MFREGKKDKAVEVLDRCIATMPNENIPYNFFILPAVESYYKMGEYDKANEIVKILLTMYTQESDYYFALDNERFKQIKNEAQQAVSVLYRLSQLTNEVYPQDVVGPMVKQEFDRLQPVFNSMLN